MARAARNDRPKWTAKGSVATQSAERYKILVLEEGGQGALIWPTINSGVACTPTYAVLSRGCYEREEAHTGAQETARLKVTMREAFGLKLSPNLLPKRPRGNSEQADVYTTKCRCVDWYGGPVQARRRPGGTDSAEMSQG